MKTSRLKTRVARTASSAPPDRDVAPARALGARPRRCTAFKQHREKSESSTLMALRIGLLYTASQEQPNTVSLEDGSAWSRKDQWVIVIPPWCSSGSEPGGADRERGGPDRVRGG